jgi:hypothetical protein
LRRFSDIDRSRVRRVIAAAALLYSVTFGPQGACHRSQGGTIAMRLRGFFRDAESGSSKKIRFLIILRAF